MKGFLLEIKLLQSETDEVKIAFWSDILDTGGQFQSRDVNFRCFWISTVGKLFGKRPFYFRKNKK